MWIAIAIAIGFGFIVFHIRQWKIRRRYTSSLRRGIKPQDKAIAEACFASDSRKRRVTIEREITPPGFLQPTIYLRNAFTREEDEE